MVVIRHVATFQANWTALQQNQNLMKRLDRFVLNVSVLNLVVCVVS